MNLRFIAIFIALTLMGCSFSSCVFSDNKTEKFNDGSEIFYPDNYSSFHHFFDDYGIHSMSGTDAIVQFSEESRKNMGNTYNDSYSSFSPVGYYVKYAFSNEEYIAYYDFDKSTSTATYYLYIVDENSLLNFSSITDLYGFLNEKKIDIGVWYHRYHSDGFCYEEELLNVKNWSIVIAGDIATVRNGYEDMFSGKIDKYISSNDYLAFHIEIKGNMESDLRAFGNPILKCEEENIIGYTLLFDIPIYYDHYVVVNCNDDSYEIFENKKDAENYLASMNIDSEWNSIKQ